MSDDYAVCKPIEFERRVTAMIAVGDDEPAIRCHLLIAPIVGQLAGQGSMKLEAPPCQRIERSAGAPVKRQKAAGVAGRRSGHLDHPLQDNDVDPTAAEVVRGTSADGAAAANHNAQRSLH
jgi:hypothetical protein